MTEQEWLEASDPIPMLEYIRNEGSWRRLKLFSCGCVRMLDTLSWEIEKAVEYVEKGEDLLLSHSEVASRIRRLAFQMNVRDTTELPWTLIEVPIEAARRVALHFRSKKLQDDLRLIAIIHCIFGNPFRPVTILPEWLTSTVLALANGIYQEKAFDRMSILADALMDGGCTNEDILNHCRQPGEHCRGCWVVDQVLGKT